MSNFTPLPGDPHHDGLMITAKSCEAQPCRSLRLAEKAEHGTLPAEQAISWLCSSGGPPAVDSSNNIIEHRIMYEKPEKPEKLQPLLNYDRRFYKRNKQSLGNALLPMSFDDLRSLIDEYNFPDAFFESDVLYARIAGHRMTSSGPCWFLRERHFSIVTVWQKKLRMCQTIVMAREDNPPEWLETVTGRCEKLQKYWSQPFLPLLVLLELALRYHRKLPNSMLVECDNLYYTIDPTGKFAAFARQYYQRPPDPFSLPELLNDLTLKRLQSISYVGNLRSLLISLEKIKEAVSLYAPVCIASLDHYIILAKDVIEKLLEVDGRFQAYITNVQIKVAQEDTQISIKLARTAAETAIAAKRDSSSMKIIAVLTTLFLPGTFVATILSTPGYTLSLSGITWIYWAIAMPLTGVVMLGLIIWLKYGTVDQKDLFRKSEETYQLASMAHASGIEPSIRLRRYRS